MNKKRDRQGMDQNETDTRCSGSRMGEPSPNVTETEWGGEHSKGDDEGGDVAPETGSVGHGGPYANTRNNRLLSADDRSEGGLDCTGMRVDLRHGHERGRGRG